MRRRRLTVIGPFWPYRGGIAHFSRAILEGLAARGHDVQAITFKRQYPNWLFPGKSQYEESEPPPALAARLIDSINPFSWRRVVASIEEAGTDVVIFNYWTPFFAPTFAFMSRAFRRRGVRVIAIVHNALPHERRPGDLALARHFFRACDGLVVMSDLVRRDVESMSLPVPIREVAHPVYHHFGDAIPKAEARLQLGLPVTSATLLFFGFIRPYKGLGVLLDAMPRVRESIPEAKLIVAGEFYSDEEDLRRKASHVGPSVQFVAEYIPEAQVAAYFCAADVVVQPYLSATQSGVAQIAFHFGKPVITTDVGGLAEVVRDGEAGLIVPAGNATALADAIVRFFEEKMEERLAAGVRRERVKYSWDPLFDIIEELAGLGDSS